MRVKTSAIIVALLVVSSALGLALGTRETKPVERTGNTLTQDEAANEEVQETRESQESPDSNSLVPMDDVTTELLFAMGVMPFRDKIPSENFVLDSLGGEEKELSDYLGKVVFLNFWATWCGPCREEMPSMQTLYDKLHEEGLEILAVDVLEEEGVVSDFVEEYGFTYPILLDRDGRVMLRYGIRAYPTTYIIDRDGYVIGVRQGYHDWSSDELVEVFRELLAAQ